MASRIVARAVSVLTTATEIAPVAMRRSDQIHVFNNGTTTIFVGPSTVTLASGYPILAGTGKVFEGRMIPKSLWAIAATSAADTRIYETFDA